MAGRPRLRTNQLIESLANGGRCLHGQTLLRCAICSHLAKRYGPEVIDKLHGTHHSQARQNCPDCRSLRNLLDPHLATKTKVSPQHQLDAAAGVQPRPILSARHVEVFEDADFTSAPLQGPAAFAFEKRAHRYLITLNSEHPAFAILQASINGPDEASASVRWLLLAWAMHENEQPTKRRSNRILDSREDWGRALRNLVSGSEI